MPKKLQEDLHISDQETLDAIISQNNDKFFEPLPKIITLSGFGLF